jgi:phospholipid/cholesterol/gamma-HCH transport system substrate-binding protein
METEPPYLRIGIFVISLFSFGLVAILWISKIDFRSNHHLYEINFPGAVTGLRENESVLFQGIPIGKVMKITVDPTDVDSIKVIVTLQEPTLIREDTVAKIEAQGLTGYAFVQLRGGNADSPVLKAKHGEKLPIIRAQVSSIDTLYTQLPQILDSIRMVAQQMSSLLDPQTSLSLKHSISNMEILTQSLTTGPRSLSLVLRDLQKTLKDVSTTSAHFNQAALHMTHLLLENREPIRQFTTHGLPTLTRLLQQTQGTLGHMDTLVGDVQNSPINFLNKNPQQGYPLP